MQSKILGLLTVIAVCVILFISFSEGRYYPGIPRCPPVCAIYCEYGNVLDYNGCPTCACNPPPAY